MEEFTTDVLICGAGAAGLALAVDLARRGVAFRLIDAASEPFRGSRGKGIQPRSLEVFEDLGVVDRMVAAGGAYPPQRVHRVTAASRTRPSRRSATPRRASPIAFR